MAEVQWYYAESNHQRGPISLADLRQLAQAARIGAETLVWQEGMTQWAAAKTIFDWWSPPPAVAATPADAALPLSQGVPLDYDSTNEIRYAGFWLRFCAWIIDRIVLGIPFIFLLRVFFAMPNPMMFRPRGGRLPFLFMSQSLGVELTEMVLRWLYFALMESSVQQGTLGKMAVGLRVTDMHGGRVSFGRATGRHFAKILSYLTHRHRLHDGRLDPAKAGVARHGGRNAGVDEKAMNQPPIRLIC